MIAKNQFFWSLLGITLIILTACNPSLEGTAEPNLSLESSSPVSTVTHAPRPTFPPLEPAFATQIAELRSPDVPELPFADNPDPSLCGIPIQWNNSEPAWLNGYYQGKLIEPEVYLYDSHLRLNIVTKAPNGTQVKVLLYQNNPYLDYYLVKIEGAELPNEGWVPGPFLSFENISTEVESQN
jgi:hypothetical protein